MPLAADPLTGRKRQRSRAFHGKARQADEALARLVSETATERAPATEGTFAFLLETWLRRAEHDLSPTTVQEYRRIADKVLIPALGAVPLRKLSPRQLDAIYDRESDRGLSPATVGQVHAVARRALGQAVKWGWLDRNPALAATPPRRQDHEVQPPTVPELLALLAAADIADPDFGMLLRVAAATGVRRGELCGLRWRDVDLDGARVSVRSAVVVVKDRKAGGTVTDQRARVVVVKDPKTHQARHVSIDHETVTLLRLHRARVDERARLDAPGGKLARDAFVFSAEPDGSAPVRPQTVSKRFRAAADAVGLTVARLHDLRHLNASLQLAAGVPLAVVSKRLGHSRQSTTLDIYSHVMDDGDSGAARVLGELLALPTKELPPSADA